MWVCVKDTWQHVRAGCQLTSAAARARTADGEPLQGAAAAGGAAQQRVRAAVCRRLEGICGVVATLVNTVFASPPVVDALVRLAGWGQGPAS